MTTEREPTRTDRRPRRVTVFWIVGIAAVAVGFNVLWFALSRARAEGHDRATVALAALLLAAMLLPVIAMAIRLALQGSRKPEND